MMKYNITYENERVQLTSTWSEMCDLFIEARETIDGYEVFIMTENYSRQLDFSECVIANQLEFDMEESLEEDRANEVDEPDPDAEYDRMKDEGELKR